MPTRRRHARLAWPALALAIELTAPSTTLLAATPGVPARVLGLVMPRDSTLRFWTDHAGLLPGTPVTVILADTTATTLPAFIAGVDADTSAKPQVSIDGATKLVAYRLLEARRADHDGVALGVTGRPFGVRRVGRALAAPVLAGDATGRVTWCTSSEDFHVMVRDPRSHHLRWHAYLHFDFDIEGADCTDADVR